MKVLITGFDPFGKEEVNPSYEAIKLLPDEILNYEIIKLEIPTIFHESKEILLKAMKKHKPRILISVGQAGGRAEITPERIAINIDDGRIADNKGNKPIDEVIFPKGENAYFSQLPIKAIVKNLRKNNIPASISNTAGTFVCNHLMYSGLYYTNNLKEFKNTKAGFIHIPYSTEQVINKSNIPSLTLEQISKGLEIAIETTIKYEKDIKVAEGKIS